MKTFRRADLFLIAGILLLAAALLLPGCFPGDERLAYIYVDGREYARIALKEGEDPYTLEPPVSPGLTLWIADGKIAFARADCPDKLCVKSGALYRAGQTAACLPAKTVVVIRGKTGRDKSFDALTY